MAEHLTVLVDRIHELLGGDPDEASKPLLAEMEHTLTDGYASALTLEGERWRIEKRIAELVREIQDAADARELRLLSEKLQDTDVDLERLRGLLDVLNERATVLRSAVL